ncbi:MAG: DNA polymerase III subunit gamma/tau, partial [Gemmatimonadetes bacterium]|nr:DNA polymerase III subunit gamma/tau [Gemmatimonadota bacterium]
MYRTALARSHRPRQFSELVGQDHVASTLRAAVENGRPGHAYLFCGPRGIGKTTAARVLAMALNCPERSGGEPCGVCGSCESIWSGRTSLDVVEIDAASNRGVDDARDLRERAMYAPSDDDRHKIYIVDEAHMLTRDAWNALLKILEEPPPRVIFVFATTEPNKIKQSASPVLSRVQRFDFRRVTVPDLLGRLREVLQREGVEAEDAALLPIARRADGGVRDALSLLDQVLSFSGDSVRLEDVRRMLGLVEEEKYLEYFSIAAAGDRAAVFPFVQALLDEGYDLAEFARGLGETLRLLLAIRLDPGAAPPELPEETRQAFADAAEQFRVEELLRMLAATADFEASGRFRRSSQPRIQLEVLLLRLASLEASIGIDELLGLLEDPTGDVPERVKTARQNKREARPTPKSKRADRPTPKPSVNQPGPKAEEAKPGTEEAEPRADSPNDSSPSPADAAGLRAVWLEVIEAAKGKGLGGEAIGLRGASVRELDDSVVHLQVPPGLAHDLAAFLNDRVRSSGFRTELGGRIGVAPDRLEFVIDDAGPRRRLTAEGARDQKLEQMMET